MRKQLFSSRNVRMFRSIFVIFLCIWLAAVVFTYSNAWFSEVVTSRGNRITTETQKLRLLTTDRGITVFSENGEPTIAPDFPETVSDLYTDDNALISLDAYDNDYKRKFLEFNGQSGIQNVSANFRQQRALIVANESDETLAYSLEFKTQELGENSLSSAFYFNYTRVGGDIPNRDFHENSGIELEPSDTIDNLGVKIEAIGSKKPIAIQPKSVHVYMVDMGILYSAGNSYLNSGLELDIVLTMSKSASATRFVSDAESLKDAIDENSGGTTFILTDNIKLDKLLKSKEPFNLDLNGFILEFVDDGGLEVKFPKRQATMDIGSIQGGQIKGAEAMIFIGVNGKSVLNWYPDITNLEKPSSYINVIINAMKIPDYTPPSSNQSSSSEASSEDSDEDSDESSSSNSSEHSSENSSSDTSSNGNSSENSSISSEDNSSSSSSNSSDNSNENIYIDYNDIRAAEDYNGGNGIRNNPYIIATVEQFKTFIEDTVTDKTDFFQLIFTVSHIKNIPAFATQKVATLIFEQDCRLEYLDFDAPIPSSNPDNPFVNIGFHTPDGYPSDYFKHLFNVSYRGGELY